MKREDAQIISEFLEWYTHSGNRTVCFLDTLELEFYPIREKTEDVLAEYRTAREKLEREKLK